MLNIELSDEIKNKLKILYSKQSVDDRVSADTGLFRYDDIYVPRNCGGDHWLSIDEVEELINNLQNYMSFFNEGEIEEINDYYRIKEEEEYYNSTHNKSIKNKKPGYIYLFKCQNKYKIGYAKDVERRLKQLDVRPFKLEYLKKVYSEDAYHIEQEIHARLNNGDTNTEWYDDMTIDKFISLVENIAKEKECSIEYK